MSDDTGTSANGLRCVEVRVFSRIAKALHYRFPDFLTDPEVGMLVRVPLGSRNELGIVTGLGQPKDFPLHKLKQVLEVIYPHKVFTEDLFELIRWMARYYAVPEAVIMDRVFPGTLRKGLKAKEQVSLKVSDTGAVEPIEALRRKAPKQAALLEFLRQQSQAITKSAVIQAMNASHATVKALIEKGWIEEQREVDERIGYRDDLAEGDAIRTLDFTLTEEQQSAVVSLTAAMDRQQTRPILLHGVTGSGKTEVYVRAIRHLLQSDPDASVLFLVPEVALAPQTVGTLRSRLESQGVEVLVWHSHLSEGERRDSWLKIAQRQCRVVVGARSAVFTPLSNLKLLIIDEEHEPAYKQEEIPRYHGRDLAVVRARINKACCIVGSATPSLESLYNVKAGKYDVVRLTRRVDNRQLPKVTLVDMRLEYRKQKKESILSQTLVEGLRERFEKREQSILFLNRRGYSRQMICPECGWVAMSDECSIPLTYHRRQNLLKCHLSGYERPAPLRCPQCQSPKIRGEGFGTQKLEDLLRAVLPKARIFRVDADTMQKKNLFRHVLADFRTGKLDVLVGTQMIAKGLDFPNVTLVGMINADHSLYMEDFRAAERTFQLLVQVSGRAGRGERAGEVIIQTSTPHASPIQFARRSDFDGFLEEEIELRREFNYPPFRHLIRHVIRDRSIEKLEFYCKKWRETLESEKIADLEIRGPLPASVEKLNGEYRYQLWYFTPRVIATVSRIQEVLERFQWEKTTRQILDVDAMNLL